MHIYLISLFLFSILPGPGAGAPEGAAPGPGGQGPTIEEVD